MWGWMKPGSTRAPSASIVRSGRRSAGAMPMPAMRSPRVQRSPCTASHASFIVRILALRMRTDTLADDSFEPVAKSEQRAGDPTVDGTVFARCSARQERLRHRPWTCGIRQSARVAIDFSGHEALWHAEFDVGPRGQRAFRDTEPERQGRLRARQANRLVIV